jgi:TolA-binding protein
MTGDPERLLSASSNADPLERELLGSVHRVGPPDGAKDQAWRAIAGQIAVVAAVGAATGSSAAAATKASVGTLASWGLGAKVAAVVAASGLTVGGGYFALRASAEPPVVVAPARQVTPSKARVAPPPSPPEAREPAPLPQADEAPSRRLEPRRQDLLRAESALLTDARAQLRSGNLGGAQASLERLQAQFPKGMLTQEREVLAIEVLNARGNVDGAKRRAKAFIKAYPRSPHSAKLARFVE